MDDVRCRIAADVVDLMDQARARAKEVRVNRLANHPAIPLVAVRDLARHTDLATTQGYVHKIESEAVTTAIGEALAGVAA